MHGEFIIRTIVVIDKPSVNTTISPGIMYVYPMAGTDTVSTSCIIKIPSTACFCDFDYSLLFLVKKQYRRILIRMTQ